MFIQRLNRNHDRRSFDCGFDRLNNHLRINALREQNANYNKTEVAVISKGDRTVVGYITHCVGLIAFDNLPDDMLKALPRYPMPVLLIARLAVDERHQGQGIGKTLLRRVEEIAVKTAANTGIYAVQVIAKDDRAYAFYLQCGYFPLDERKKSLYVPLHMFETVTQEEYPDPSMDDG